MSNQRRRPIAAIMCLATVLVGCSPAGENTAETTTGADVPAGGPEVVLDGTYVVTWSGRGTRNGVVGEDLHQARNGWVFRTACGDGGCVATGGSIADPANPTAPVRNVRVADFVDGRWQLVYFTADATSCAGPGGVERTADGWTVWDIAIGPDRALVPTVTTIATDDCANVEVQTLSMERVDEPLAGFPLPEPADQPRREAPAAAAFDGRYTVTRTRRDRPAAPETAVHVVATSCLRDAARCVTTSATDDSADATSAAPQTSVYQFAGDTFTRRTAATVRSCDDGRDGVAEETETLTLPPATNPARPATLTGQRVTTFTEGCPGVVTEDVRYEMEKD